MLKIKKTINLIVLLIVILTSTVVFAKNNELFVNESILNTNKTFLEEAHSLEDVDKLTNNYDLEKKDYNLTDDELNLIEYYKQTPLRVGLYSYDTFFIEIDQKYFGLNYYLIQKFASQFDVKIEYVLAPKDELISMINTGDIDILLSTSDNHTDLLETKYFSNSYFFEVPFIYSKDMTKSDIIVDSLNNMKIGKRADSEYFNENDLFYSYYKDINIEIIKYESDADLIRAYDSGEINYILSSTNMFLLSNGFYQSNLVGDNIGTFHHIAVTDNQNSTTLTSVINKFIDEDMQKQLYIYPNLFNTARYKEGYFFTHDEKVLLEQGIELNVASLYSSSYPFLYLDTEGKLTGSEIFIFDRISKLLNIDYNLTLITTDEYNNIISNLDENETDVVLGVFPYKDNKNFIDFSKPTTSSKYVLIGYNDKINYLSDLFNYRIGLIEGETVSDYLQYILPAKNFEIFDSVESANKALTEKKIDYIPVNQEYYKYLIFFTNDYNIRNCYELDFNYNSTIPFIKNENSYMLASIYSKSISFVNKTEILNTTRKIYEDAIFNAVKISHTKKFLIFTIPFLIAILGYLIFNNLKIRKNRKKILELSEKYNDILISTGASFWYYDIITKEFIIQDDFIILVDLDEKYYKVVNDRTVLILSNDFQNYFVDVATANSIICVFNQILNLEESRAEFDFDFKKGMDENNIIRLKITLRFDNISDQKAVYGLIQNTTATHLYESKLRSMALYDPLTGAGNRSSLFETLNSDYYGKVICYMDLDDFKKVNDTYGHEHGDYVLKSVVARVNKISEISQIYRIGGDEFVFIQETLDLDAIIEAQKSISTLMTHKGVSYRVYATIGVLPTTSYDASSFEEYLNLADMIMLYAKNQGKNTIEVYDKNKTYPAVLK